MIAALLNCSFSSVKAFCQKREIPLEGLEMDFTGEFEDGAYSSMRFSLRLPQGFPEKYEGTPDKIFDTCAVKKIMKSLPEIAVETTRAGSGNGGG